MATMKAMTIHEFGGLEKLHMENLSIPELQPDEVQIQIAYTSVNPVDWKIREGLLKDWLPHHFPLVLGWDAAGVITQVGSDVEQFKVGDEVFAYCRKPTVQFGTYAEYVNCLATSVALKPQTISFAEAAAVPLAGLTAWQAIIDYAQLEFGQSVLIQAGAGGVGSFAVQIAKYLGAKVYSTASHENHAYVKSLGADFVFDYREENVAEKLKRYEPKGVDVALDCVGGETLRTCYSLVKPGGRLVSIAGQIDNGLTEKYKIRGSFCFVAPNGEQLEKMAHLIDQGKLKVPFVEEMNLEKAAEAQQRSREGHTKGKIVLKVS